jgi:hypothetical protein
MHALLALNPATEKGGVPITTLALVHLRAGQINARDFLTGANLIFI